MMVDIKKQEKVVAEALSELERLSEVTEAKMDEWDILRDKEQKAFEAWRVEHRLLGKMKEEQNG